MVFYCGLDLLPVSICTSSAASLAPAVAIGLGGVSQRPGIRAR